jgi:hypothetical protein
LRQSWEEGDHGHVLLQECLLRRIPSFEGAEWLLGPLIDDLNAELMIEIVVDQFGCPRRLVHMEIGTADGADVLNGNARVNFQLKI